MKEGINYIASWIIHLRIADGLKNDIKDIDIEKFIVGNIAPDCGKWSDDGNIILLY